MAVALLLASTWPHPGDRHSFAGTPGILEYGVMEWRSEGVVVRLRSASFRRRQGSGGTRRRDLIGTFYGCEPDDKPGQLQIVKGL